MAEDIPDLDRISNIASLRLHFLGSPRFTRDEKAIEIGSTKAVALLAYLALTRLPQAREHLLSFFWPASAPEAARKNLRNMLWILRKTLADEVVHTHTDRLALNKSLWVDVWEFERRVDLGNLALKADGSRDTNDADGYLPAELKQSIIGHLQAAVALYQGPLLQNLPFVDEPEFDLWMMAERERLGKMYAHVLIALINAYRVEGNWQAMLALAQQALRHDPLQEPMYRVLMEAHAHLGERSEALNHYATLRAILMRELGVEPLPETKALYISITRGDIEAAARPPQKRRVPAQQPRPMMSEPPQVPFIGREVERTRLDAELEKATSGSARIVLLTGELGIGKSRLWQEWSAGLGPERTILETRCLESTRTLPFVPLIELLSSQQCMRRLFTPPSPLAVMWLAEVARLLPDVLRTFPTIPPPAQLPPEEERRRLFEAFVQCFLALEARPLVLFIDDVHWAERTWLDWLDYAIHRLGKFPFLLIMAYRLEDASGELVQRAAQWSHDGLAQRLTVPRLTPDESAALVSVLGGDVAQATPILAQSAGNPYFIIELMHAEPGNVPSELAELIRTRLANLPEDARQVLQAAAVLEPEIDYPTLRYTSGRGEDETLDALDTLMAAGVLIERTADYHGGQFVFAHPLVATIIRRGLSGARRSVIHRRAAEARETAYAGRLPLVAGLLARHYTEAGNFQRAAQYAEMAAEHMLALGATAEAVVFYQQSLALEPRPSRRLGLGRALHRQGNLADAYAAFETAQREFEAQGDREQAAQACLGMADAYLSANRFEEVMHWAARSLAYLDSGGSAAAKALAHFLLGAAQMRSGQALTEAEQHLTAASDLATEHHLLGMEARSCFELGNVRAIRGERELALETFLKATLLAQLAGDPFQEALGHNNAAYNALHIGKLTIAREHIEAGLAVAEMHQLVLPYQWLYSTRGELAMAEGNYAEAESWFRRGLVETERLGNRRQAANYQVNLGLVAWGQGDLERAALLLEEACEQIEQLSAPYLSAQTSLWLAEIYWERGEHIAALQAIARVKTKLEKSEYRHLQAWMQRLTMVRDHVKTGTFRFFP